MAKNSKSAPTPPLPSPPPAAPTESDTDSDNQSDEVEVPPSPASKSKSLSAFQASDDDESDENSDEIEVSPPAPKGNSSRSTMVWSDQDLHALFSWLETHLQKTGIYPTQKDYEAAGGGMKLFSNIEHTWPRVYEKMRRLRSTFLKNYSKGKLPTDPCDRKIYKISKKIWGPKKDFAEENNGNVFMKSKHSRHRDNLLGEGGVAKKQKTAVSTGSHSGITHFPHLRYVIDKILEGEPIALDGIDQGKAAILENDFIKLRRDEAKLKARVLDLYKQVKELIAQVWADM